MEHLNNTILDNRPLMYGSPPFVFLCFLGSFGQEWCSIFLGRSPTTLDCKSQKKFESPPLLFPSRPALRPGGGI